MQSRAPLPHLGGHAQHPSLQNVQTFIHSFLRPPHLHNQVLVHSVSLESSSSSSNPAWRGRARSPPLSSLRRPHSSSSSRCRPQLCNRSYSNKHPTVINKFSYSNQQTLPSRPRLALLPPRSVEIGVSLPPAAAPLQLRAGMRAEAGSRAVTEHHCRLHVRRYDELHPR